MKLTRRTLATALAGLFAAPVAAKVASAAVEPGCGGGIDARMSPADLARQEQEAIELWTWTDSHGGVWDMKGPDAVPTPVHLPKGHPLTIAHHAHPDKKP